MSDDLEITWADGRYLLSLHKIDDGRVFLYVDDSWQSPGDPPTVEMTPEALASLAAHLCTLSPAWVAGLFDEHEFDAQEPPHGGFVARGPYFSLDRAREVARSLSTDPDEAVILELRP